MPGTLLESGRFFHAKLLLRFIAGLTRIIEDDGIVRVLEQIAAKVEGEQSARTDSFAWLLLLTMPYVAVSPKAPVAGLNALFERVAPYMEARNSSETAFVSPFKGPRPDVPSSHIPLLEFGLMWVWGVRSWRTFRCCIYCGFKRRR